MGDEEICCTLLLVTAELRESYGSEVRISDPVLCGNLINTVDNVKGVRVLGGMRMTESKRICALETLPQCAHSSSELLGGRLSRDERWLCSSFGSESEQDRSYTPLLIKLRPLTCLLSALQGEDKKAAQNKLENNKDKSNSLWK
ncbi:hypothetical protein MJT46_000472 [Ovis ammon polii x Ovis aries]|nr:hypothetical protein MJT46_000472 [Ovis ammon polii x Ovis aries]